MNYGPNYKTNALTVAFDIHADVEATIYDTEYPEYEWPSIVLPEQIKTNINPGATSYAYKTRDHNGVAAFIGAGPNNDIPMVGVAMGAVDVPIVTSAVGFRITNQEARQYQFGHNADIASELGTAAGTAAENLIEKSLIFGNADLKLRGWINYPHVSIIGMTKRWSVMTPEEKIATLGRPLGDMWEGTNKLFMPTDLYLPMSIYRNAAETPMTVGGVGMGKTILEFFKENNLAIDQRGGVRVHASRYLSTAGTDGQNRIIAIDRNAKNQVFPFPMEYIVGQPVPEPLGAAWYGEQVFGSYHVRQIGSMLYMDGI